MTPEQMVGAIREKAQTLGPDAAAFALFGADVLAMIQERFVLVDKNAASIEIGISELIRLNLNKPAGVYRWTGETT